MGGAIAGLTYPLIFGHGSEPVAGSGLSFGVGRKPQASYAPPSGYEQQWNQGQPQQWQAPAAPPQQAWGQPQPPAQNWGQPPAQAARPRRHPSSGASRASTPTPRRRAAAGQQPPAQQWGQPIEDDGEDGRTQVRRPD